MVPLKIKIMLFKQTEPLLIKLQIRQGIIE